MSGRVAARYGKSLMDLAQEKSKDEAVYNDMVMVADLAQNSPELKQLLRNPIISGSDKLKVLSKVFESTDELTKRFVELVVERKRESALAEMALDYIRRYDAAKGLTKVIVRSAIALDDSSLSDVKRYLKGAVNQDDIQIENIVDPSVIGGMVIQFEDKLMDLSVARELKEIRKQLIYN